MQIKDNRCCDNSLGLFGIIGSQRLLDHRGYLLVVTPAGGGQDSTDSPGAWLGLVRLVLVSLSVQSTK